MVNKQIALVVGGSGLIGSLLTEKLLHNDSFAEVKVFLRKKSGNTHPKIKEIIVDFENSAQLENDLKGDVVFCCLGTTIRVAGSQEAFEKVDLHYPVNVSVAAYKNGVKKFMMVSSLGADAASSNFYLRTKGKCEKTITESGISSVYFFRPSMLLGKRKEFRFGEIIGKGVMIAFSFLFIGKLKRYKAVQAAKVADAMIHFSLQAKAGVNIVENEEILAVKG